MRCFHSFSPFILIQTNYQPLSDYIICEQVIFLLSAGKCTVGLQNLSKLRKSSSDEPKLSTFLQKKHWIFYYSVGSRNSSVAKSYWMIKERRKSRAAYWAAHRREGRAPANSPPHLSLWRQVKKKFFVVVDHPLARFCIDTVNIKFQFQFVIDSWAIVQQYGSRLHTYNFDLIDVTCQINWGLWVTTCHRQMWVNCIWNLLRLSPGSCSPCTGIVHSL